MEIWSGDPDEFTELFPEGSVKDDSCRFYYDKTFSSCSAEDAFYQMIIYPEHSTGKRGGLLSFTDMAGRSLYSQQILYPVAQRRGEPDE